MEGATIYYGPGDTGYLIVSSQGSHDYADTVARATTSFCPSSRSWNSRSIDATSNTDGIDVIPTPLGPSFPTGLLVVQDGDNDPDENNFKVVPWDLVAGSANPGLMVETGWTPRGENTLNLPRPSLPDTPAVGGASWNVAGGSIANAVDDDDGASGSAKSSSCSKGRESCSASRTSISRMGRCSGGPTSDSPWPIRVTEMSCLPSPGFSRAGTESTAVTWLCDGTRVTPLPANSGTVSGHRRDDRRWLGAGRCHHARCDSNRRRVRSAVAFDAAPESAPALMLEYTQEG